MKTTTTWFNRQIENRKLIESDENKITITQIIGFIIQLVGVCYLLYVLLCGSGSTQIEVSGDRLAIAFFIITLGVSMAFPSLLKDHNNGLSTMRIIVFMMANVICLLLIKLGWEANDLEDIGLDSYWVAIIAFVFGAKATQAYFESKLAIPKSIPSKVGVAALKYTNAEIAKLAVKQNQEYLNVKFPNIISISDAVNDMSKEESHIISIYLKDSNTIGIPEMLEVKMHDGTIKTINTEVIEDVGDVIAQCNQYDSVGGVNNNLPGSICCIAKLQDKNILVTAGHVYSMGNCRNMGGWLYNDQSSLVRLNGKAIVGKWIYQLISRTQDIAFVELNDNIKTDDFIKFGRSGYYKITDDSIKNEEVTLISSKGGKRDGYILDYNIAWPINYNDEQQMKSNIIVVGSFPDRNSSVSLSEEGDSGGVVYHKKSGKLIGLILGSDKKKFTLVMPIKNTLDSTELTLI